jgi:D-beta-D-heptose 7-phosphate kinase/D-beta-D-heptose 1-phosphate adenosyltransferase
MIKVMGNGTFDILHRGHLEMLKFARQQGQYLLVAIDTDRRVKELKGSSRPINNQEDRMFHLMSLEFVNEVKLFDSKEELVELMKLFKPDIYVKGSDWKSGTGTAQKYAKEVIYYDRIGDYSTTNIIQRITDR